MPQLSAAKRFLAGRDRIPRREMVSWPEIGSLREGWQFTAGIFYGREGVVGKYQYVLEWKGWRFTTGKRYKREGVMCSAGFCFFAGRDRRTEYSLDGKK